jgi:hypothetical protein
MMCRLFSLPMASQDASKQRGGENAKQPGVVCSCDQEVSRVMFYALRLMESRRKEDTNTLYTHMASDQLTSDVGRVDLNFSRGLKRKYHSCQPV